MNEINSKQWVTIILAVGPAVGVAVSLPLMVKNAPQEDKTRWVNQLFNIAENALGVLKTITTSKASA